MLLFIRKRVSPNIIKSIKQLEFLKKNVKLILVGAGSYLDPIKRLVNVLGIKNKVKIIKKQKKIDLLKYTGIVVYPSIWDENCPMAILESLAAGKIVICTARGGNSELIDDLFNGFIVNEKDYNAITKKILLLQKYEGLREYLSFNSKKVHNKKFFIKHQIKQLENLYRKVIS